MKYPKSLQELMQKYSSEKACIKLLEQERWPDGKIKCPHCDHDKIYRLKNDGWYKCANQKCYKKFSIRKGTIFQASNAPLPIWYLAIYIATGHKKGISSHQLAKDLKITQKTAWTMLTKIREMVRVEQETVSNSKAVVQVDESYIGGKNRNRHSHKKIPASQGRSSKDKVPVFGILRGGNVIVKVVPDTKASTLQPLIHKLVTKGSIIVSDEWLGYSKIDRKGDFGHLVVEHKKGEYTRGAFHTNSIENFWSVFKRCIYGTYYKVSKKHMHRYCNEIGYRYNTRQLSDSDRFILTLRNCLGALPYKQLIQGL